jgi:hypothetical protein
MNTQDHVPASANADALQTDLIALLSRCEFVRGELAQLTGVNQQGPALKIFLQMIDYLAQLAEKHLGTAVADPALAAAAELYNQVELFRQHHVRSGRFSLASLIEPSAARASRRTERREAYLRVAALAVATFEQFLQLFTPYFPSGAEDWAQVSETFLTDLQQTMAALQ